MDLIKKRKKENNEYLAIYEIRRILYFNNVHMEAQCNNQCEIYKFDISVIQ